jgi:hypothetical protein
VPCYVHVTMWTYGTTTSTTDLGDAQIKHHAWSRNFFAAIQNLQPSEHSSAMVRQILALPELPVSSLAHCLALDYSYQLCLTGSYVKIENIKTRYAYITDRNLKEITILHGSFPPKARRMWQWHNRKDTQRGSASMNPHLSTQPP